MKNLPEAPMVAVPKEIVEDPRLSQESTKVVIRALITLAEQQTENLPSSVSSEDQVADDVSTRLSENRE
ncbi:MAG: hypothetical protein WDZ94_01470 [Patescibacteria group bacterium]